MNETRFAFLASILAVLFFLPPGVLSREKSPRIRVGVFDGHGGAQTCIWETVEALRLDAGIDAALITAAEIAGGSLEQLDVLVIPGGGGSRQYLNLGALNHQRIKAFVESGKGLVGICAGAYLLSNTPGYACLGLNGSRAIDIEHDNRGHGVVKFSLHSSGRELFPELAKRKFNYMVYYEGPVFVDARDGVDHQVLAVMESDVHEEGNAPANMTNGKPFFVANRYGGGRVFSCIAHPEATPGMRWMVPRMARWAAGGERIAYDERVVRPDRFEREILFTRDMLQEEARCFQVFLYGAEAEKIGALDWLETHLSWDAKRWVQGLLYDAAPAVRERAARYIERCELTMFEADIAASRKAR